MITTPRLHLRRHRLDDFASTLALWSDPAVTRYIGGKPSTEEECWSRFLRYAGHWDFMQFGYWVVEELGTGEFVGELGFADFRRDIVPSLAGTLELGWVLGPRFHRRGLATEGALAALSWADTHFPTTRTACIIDPENLASIRVAEKCGFREIARTTYKTSPTIVYERMRATPPSPSAR
jgi:RimJ/RimL family protein N-acetyltransferase